MGKNIVTKPSPFVDMRLFQEQAFMSLPPDSSYIKCIKQSYNQQIKNKFPLVKLQQYDHGHYYLIGCAATKRDQALYDNPSNYLFNFVALIPDDYMINGIIIMDAYHYYTKVIYEDYLSICHLNWNDSNAVQSVCTHNMVDITTKNCMSLPIVNSEHLYKEYLRFDKTKDFRIQGYQHGGNKQSWMKQKKQFKTNN